MHSHSQASILVHIVWSTHRRLPVLPVGIDPSLAALLVERAAALGCPLLGVGIASDHVHVVARLATTVPLADLVQRLKGGSAHEVNAGRLLSARLRWQGGYWAESLRPRDVEPLLGYLGAQRAHHDDAHPAELWQLTSA